MNAALCRHGLSRRIGPKPAEIRIAAWRHVTSYACDRFSIPMTTVLYASRFLLATLLNAVLLLFGGWLSARGEPWQQWVFGLPYFLALFLLPILLLAPRGPRTARAREIVIASALSCLFAGAVLSTWAYLLLGRPPRIAFAVAVVILLLLAGALSGWIGFMLHHAFLVRPQETSQR